MTEETEALRPQPVEVPEYRLLADAFFAPKMVYAGSIIRTFLSPGPHMQPLNQAARDRMEEWYNEEHPTLDKDGSPNYEKMWKPHLQHKLVTQAPAVVHEVEVLTGPSQAQTGELSLAESVYARYKDTDQRPGPSPVYAPTEPQQARLSPEPVRVPGLSENEAMAEQSRSAVVAEVTKPADPRKAGIKVS
jgi:hypothetical protein